MKDTRKAMEFRRVPRSPNKCFVCGKKHSKGDLVLHINGRGHITHICLSCANYIGAKAYKLLKTNRPKEISIKVFDTRPVVREVVKAPNYLDIAKAVARRA